MTAVALVGWRLLRYGDDFGLITRLKYLELGWLLSVKFERKTIRHDNKLTGSARSKLKIDKKMN